MLEDFLYRFSGAIFGAIGGAISVLVCAIFASLISPKWKIGFISVSTFLGFVFGNLASVGTEYAGSNFSDKYVQPQLDKIVIRNALKNSGQTSGFYKLLDLKEPETFNMIIDVAASKLRGAVTQSEITNEIRSVIIDRISKPRLRYLDDDALVFMYINMASMMRQLAEKSPETCIKMIKGEPFGDLTPYINQDTQKQEYALLEKFIGLQPKTYNLLSSQEVQELNGNVIFAISEKYPDKLQFLNIDAVPLDKKQTCLMFSMYINEIINLPKPQAAGLIRVMIIDPARLG
jgi:hypothetical protein